VNSLVSFGERPTQVPDQLIQQLQQRFEVNRPELISSLPKKGDSLQILDGPFRGLNAVFSQIDGDSRAVVLLTILKQKVRAVLPFSSLSPVAKSSQCKL
jgi:transcriptional antiterminator RfaH